MSQELIGYLVTVALTIGTWIYHQAKGDKHASITETVMGLVDQAIHFAVVTADAKVDEVRAQVLEYVWKGLALAKVPRNALSEGVVNAAVEQAIAYALQQAREHDRLVQANAKTAMDAIRDSLPLDVAKLSHDELMERLLTPKGSIPKLEVPIEVVK